jgi:hypothetical protein
MPGTNDDDNVKTAYDQVCTGFHKIDDFRAKLLGFLPLVTGGGLVLLTGRLAAVDREFFGPAGLFGILVTIGLLVYELNGMRRCRDLIYDGEALENTMRLKRGQFITRANHPPRIFTKPFAAAWIYPAVLAAWTYLALYVDRPGLAQITSATVFVLALVVILLYDQSLSKKPKPAWLFKLARSLRSRRQHLPPHAKVDKQVGTRGVPAE